MARQFLMIDGYNLMHAAGMARPSYGPGDLERCRNRLLRFLKSVLTPTDRRRTTIVFDAWEPPPGRQSVVTVADMTVRFADAPGEADAVIEQLIAAHSAPKQLTVVSGDRRLQQAASRRKARYVDSETWYAQWEGHVPPLDDEPLPPVSPKRGGELSPEEIDYWMSVFDDVDAPRQDDPHRQQGLPDVIDDDFDG